MDLAGLAIEVVHGLAARGLTVSVSEHYTQGMIASALRAVPGSPGVLSGWLQLDTLEQVAAELGSAELLAIASDPANFGKGKHEHEITATLAQACQRRFNSDLALAIFAIPESENPERQPPAPACTVCWCVCRRGYLPRGSGAIYRASPERMRLSGSLSGLDFLLSITTGAPLGPHWGGIKGEQAYLPGQVHLAEADQGVNDPVLDEMLRIAPPPGRRGPEAA